MTKLYETFGTLDGQLGQLSMVVSRAVESRCDDLAADSALEVSDLLGALVDQHHHEVNFGVIASDRVCDRLHDHRLASLWRRNDETALAFTNRTDEIDDPPSHVFGVVLETQTFLRIQRSELRKLRTLLHLLGINTINLLDFDQRRELFTPLPFAMSTHLTDDDVAFAQAVPTHYSHRDIGIIGARKISRSAHKGILVTNVEDARARDKDVVLTHIRF